MSGELTMSDFTGPSMAVGGSGLTMTPVFVIQIIGAFVGIAGVILTLMRIYESRQARIESKLSRLEAKRANDIAEQQLEFKKLEASKRDAKAGYN